MTLIMNLQLIPVDLFKFIAHELIHDIIIQDIEVTHDLITDTEVDMKTHLLGLTKSTDTEEAVLLLDEAIAVHRDIDLITGEKEAIQRVTKDPLLRLFISKV